MHGASLLVVEDDEAVGRSLVQALTGYGALVGWARTASQALGLAGPTTDLVLLDLGLPDIDGVELCRRLRDRYPHLEIIVLTARGEEIDIVVGLDAGADDYITKPINFAELEARIKALLRIKALQEELERANAELRRVSQTDGLTGVDNRRHIEQRLTEAFQHAARLNESLAVVMTDVDHFKSVNDTYGHQAGDAVLKQVAEVLRESAREIDHVGRYGGEEFLVLLPGASAEDARAFAERARAAIAAREFAYAGGTLQRTMSAGVASWPHPELRHQEALVKAADDALYVAKSSGRNRVVAFGNAEVSSAAA